MRFALLGEHPDGLDLARALADSGRHSVVAVSALLDEATLVRLGQPHRVSDVEEILADPAVEAVIVAGGPASRAAQLRRALQSERHVLCAHPAGDRADVAYEAALLQGDTGKVLLPLLPEALHPALTRLAELVGRSGARSPLGDFRLLQVQRASTGELLDDAGGEQAAALPGWDVLRRVGGELAEVSSLADGDELTPGRPVLLAGRFADGGLFQVTLLPHRRRGRWTLTIIGSDGQAELTRADGWDGPAQLCWHGADGAAGEESWPAFDPWPALIAAFETALRGEATALTWDDAVRALELDEAVRGSAARGRVQRLEYPDASEEAGFKGTMTLLGCGLLWALLLLLVFSRWLPALGWLALPLLLAFIGLQMLRYALPKKDGPTST